jgi:hypothetical protein
VPGIQPKDVQYLLDKGADKIILSQGYQSKLKVAPETLEFLEQCQNEKKIEYLIQPTAEAVLSYNEWVNNKQRVGALIHSTC